MIPCATAIAWRVTPVRQAPHTAGIPLVASIACRSHSAARHYISSVPAVVSHLKPDYLTIH